MGKEPATIKNRTPLLQSYEGMGFFVVEMKRQGCSPFHRTYCVYTQLEFKIANGVLLWMIQP